MALIKSVFIGLVLVVLLSSRVEGNNNFKSNLAIASKTLSDKGFNAMSVIFNVFFHTLIKSSNGNLTIFCPSDTAFFCSKFTELPSTLLQYHVVPLKLNNEDLGFIHHGYKIDTLLHGHPLVVTSLPSSHYVSLNEVRVTEWNLYNNGGLVVHGVDNFFDPAFQTLIYPQLDPDVKKQDLSIEGSRFYKVTESTDRWVLVLAFVVIGLGVLVLSLYRCYEYGHDHDYVPIPVHDIANVVG